MTNTFADTQTIGRRIRALRIKSGLTQQQLAARADLTQRQIARVEAAEADSLRLDDFLSLVTALQWDMSNILDKQQNSVFEQSNVGTLGIPTGTILDYHVPFTGVCNGMMTLLIGEGSAQAALAAAQSVGTDAVVLESITCLPNAAELVIVDWTDPKHTSAADLLPIAYMLCKRDQQALMVAVNVDRETRTGHQGTAAITDYPDFVMVFSHGDWTITKNRYGTVN